MYTGTYYIKIKAFSPQTQWRCVQDYFTYNIIDVTWAYFLNSSKLGLDTFITAYTEVLEPDPAPCTELKKATAFILIANHTDQEEENIQVNDFQLSFPFYAGVTTYKNIQKTETI